MRLNNKVAVITGATSGIGEATARLFIAEGASVVLCGRRQKLGESLIEELGEKATFVTADIRREEDVKRVIDTAVERFDKLDILFNNAGGPGPAGDIAEVSSADFDTAVNLILRSVFYGIKYAGPYLCSQQSGAIISNASVSAHLGGYATSHIYSALKAAVVQLSKSVALEFAEHNVRVNTVSPGPIATGIFGRGAGLDADSADQTAEKMKKALKKAQPIPRAGLPEDVAAAVAFLASDEAGFITGRDLVIDGGMIAGRPYSQVQAQRKAMKDYLGG